MLKGDRGASEVPHGPQRGRWGTRRAAGRGQRGSIAVETAITLPILLLLTIGGLSVVWWLVNKALMQLMVAEIARERAADGVVVGLYNDVTLLLSQQPKQAYGLPQPAVVSLKVPLTDPPFVLAAACTAPGGVVPLPPGFRAPAPGPDGSDPAREVREAVQGVGSGLERISGGLDQVIAWEERLIFYRRVLESLRKGSAYQKRQAYDYLLGGGVELAMPYACKERAGGGTIITAKAVIQGEKTYAQR